MNEPIIIIGQFSIATITIALITVLINHILANTRDARNRRLVRGERVIEVFQPELDRLIQTDSDALLIMTDEAFNRHDPAIRSFLRYLSWIDRIRLLYAWRTLAYHKEDKEHHIPLYEQYADFGSLDKRRKIRPIVIKRIEHIISFASE